MNAVTTALAERPLDASQVGEIFAAWQIAPDALMLLGWQREKPARDGAVALQRGRGQRGRFTCIAWRSQEAGAEAYRFLAAVRLPHGADARCGETLLLTARGETAGLLARLPGRFLDPAIFAAELARAAIGSAAAVARFLTDAFTPATTRGNAAIRSMVAEFLARASEPDGCVEIAGAVPDGCAFLQGWGTADGAECDIVLAGAAIERHTAHVASFARPDITEPATGQMLVLPAPVGRALSNLASVFLLGRSGIRRRVVIEERRLLAEQDAISHLRAILPSLRCSPAGLAVLKAALRPRFDGRLTLHDAGHPVRIAVDLAVSAKDAGAYLTGWLYDPAAAVEELCLRGTQGRSARLDGSWTRIPREDVTDAFRADPALRAELAHHDHGFAIHVAGMDATDQAEAYFLDVSFRDGACGFVPVTIAPAGDETVRARLLAGVDLHKPSGMQVIEAHLGPFFERLSRRRPEIGAVTDAEARGGLRTAIVTPLGEPVLPRAVLSQFLRDPLADDEGLVFVCGENWTDAGLRALRAQASFYGVDASVVRIRGTATPALALDAAARVSNAACFLLLGAGTSGRAPGWRRALHAALKASGGDRCVSPTVLYEDDSIRFAGIHAIEPLEAAPYAVVRRHLAGMPASLAALGKPLDSFAASLACCLIPREIIDAIGGAARVTAAPSGEEAELFLRVRQAGIGCVWAPSAQVYATEAEAGQGGARKVASLIDGWRLRARLTAGKE